MSNQTLPSHHFDCGNSTTGTIGFCGRIQAADKNEALEILRDVLPDELRITPVGEDENNARVEYLAIYLSPQNVQIHDIDEVDDETCEALTDYMVIGLYADNDQRFAESVEAVTPEKAEELFRQDHPDVLIAGVLAGDHLEVVA